MKSLYYFDIDDELFSELKLNLNRGLNSILDKMVNKDVCEGELTLSVKVSLRTETVTDCNGEVKEILTPEISHKEITKMSVKGEEKGKINGITHDGFLALTKVNNRYAAVLTPPDASQLTLEDQRRFAGLDEDEETASFGDFGSGRYA